MARRELVGAAVLGDLYVNAFSCLTLENAARSIPAGTYRVTLTVSGRAVSGSLWSPREDRRLPLVCDVPGRTGIRVHAANRPGELEGCIALGRAVYGDTLGESRNALIEFMAKLDVAERIGEACWLHLEDACV